MPKVKLTHHCCKPGCEGQIGDVLQVSDEDAEFLQSRGGGVLVETAEDGPAKAATKSAKSSAKRGRETAEEAAAGEAEKR